MLEILYKTILEDGICSLSVTVFCTNCSGIEEEHPGLSQVYHNQIYTDNSKDLIDSRRDTKLQLKASEQHAAVWQELVGQAVFVRTVVTVKDAVEFVDETYTGARILVAGGLYLAGAVRSIVCNVV
jgi:folylpolyglutamate synthase/dihydropteroate synthase